MLQAHHSGNGSEKTPVQKAGWKYSIGVRVIIFICLGILFYFGMSGSVLPEKFDIEVGHKSEKDIVSPKQIEDKKATLKAQEEAVEAISPIYPIVSIRQEKLIDDIFSRIEDINKDDLISFSEKVDLFRRVIPQMFEDHVSKFVRDSRNNDTYSATLLDEIAKRVSEQAYQIPEETYIKIARLTPEDVQEMRPVGREIVGKLMSDSVLDASGARTKVAEHVNASSLSKRSSREVVQELVRLSITPNKFFDAEATQLAKDEAREKTPVVYIKQGDVIVKRGQVITQETYDLLKANDLLKTEVNLWPQFGLLVLSLLFTFAIYMYIRQNSLHRFKYNNTQLLMLALIFGIEIVLYTIVAAAQSATVHYVGFLAPAALGVILVTLLLDVSAAYVSAIVLSLAGSIILNRQQDILFDFNYGLLSLVVSFAAIFALSRASQRSTIIKSCMMVCIFGAGSVFVLSILQDGLMTSRETLFAAGFAFASGLVTAVLVLGLMPFFEATFGILSALKLVELSSPNQPLLRKLLTETPGTYHHSVMVGNLAEQAAEAIGANGLLCRVGAFYHDIGKTKRPSYFIENQTNMDNPHDFIDPDLSASIITAHARDGAEMLKEYKIPKPIRDIAEQHHGTSFLKFFYFKALKLAEQEGVEPSFTEDDFRYPGPKAQSKEAAIVGIADSVEAAVRSLRHPTVDQIESMIQKIIRDKLEDNQFNECDLTMRELDSIAHSLKETVMGIFHSRIEYPDMVKDKASKPQGIQEPKPSQQGLAQPKSQDNVDSVSSSAPSEASDISEKKDSNSKE
ncbi:HD family phosphohydrolase [Paenibacillus aquistagni]|uniref:HD family phosphohydrolase n=1 Tax=Paenibacillus aquistagni TaxID=1852522 RepID=UPI000B5077A7|nr:HDIG domain-containing metalloprotein [Paenibacillus aquistagni]